MKIISDRMNIVYATDEKFAEILSVSMESLLEHNSSVVIYILDNGICEESVKRLKRQADKYDAEMHIMKLKKLKEYAGRELLCQTKITTTTYFRLFLSEILPDDVEKVLYIDCDTLICDDLSELYYLNLNNTCGNVAEPTAPLMKKKINIKPDDTYFNAGIMLIDLKRWREERINKKFVDYIEEMEGKISFEDQGVINHVLNGKIDVLPVRYNVETQYFDFGYDGFQIMKNDKSRYAEKEVIDAMNNPAIIHFTNSFVSERPWVNGSKHKYLEKWIKYKEKTEWKNSESWSSNKDFVRRISKIIYSILPRKAGLKFIYLVNGILRAFME